MTTATKTVAFQGEPGAYSHLAIREAMPGAEALPCPTFEDAFAAVADGKADLGMIPIENSLAGRVADIHHLMPESGLYIIGEHFHRVHHQLLALPGATLEGLRSVTSHQMALAQCRSIIRDRGLRAVQHADTAGAARDISLGQDRSVAAIASSLAAEVYGLQVLARDVEDADHNTTRFVILAREAIDPGPDNGPTVTSFVFRVRNVPAALYKALGGFATNGVNLTKLESYQLDGTFTATQFYADAEGHPSQRPLALALEELGFFCSYHRILGTYPANAFRGRVGDGG